LLSAVLFHNPVMGYKYSELGGIHVALVHGKTGGKVELVVEEMDARQARLFYLPDLGKFMGK